MAAEATFDAAALVGLLADDDRRRCFAAVELGARTLDDVVAAAALTPPRAATALGRLAASGVIHSADDGGLAVDADAVRAVARAALARPRRDEHDHLPPSMRSVVSTFVVDGRITQIPVAASKRGVLLDWLAQDFEPGRRYSEPAVNLILGKRHPDTAALRRYLVDAGVLDRDHGEYWRSGGSVAL